MRVARPVFEKMIREAMAEIPAIFRQRMENIAITIEPAASPEIRHKLRVSPPDFLLGLYQGIPRTRRGADYGNVLPDKISIYQDAITRDCQDLKSVKTEVRRVLRHEIGHYFGLNDKELHQLENEARRSRRDHEAEA